MIPPMREGEIENREETDEDLFVRIQDAAFEIEVEESNRLVELSAKGKIAVDLVTKLGNE